MPPGSRAAVYGVLAAADVSRSCSSCASSAVTSPIPTRSSGLMKPSLIRKPPARTIASRSGTAQWCSSKTSAAEAHQSADLAAELDRLLLGQVAEMLHLQLAVRVLVHGQRVDHTHRVALAQPLQLSDDLTVEVRMPELQYDELHRTNSHILVLSLDRLALSGQAPP